VPRGYANGTIVWQRGPHWYEAQRINSVMKIYGEFLLGRKSTGVYRANTTTGGGVPYTVDNSSAPTPECVIAHLANNGPISADWLVGVFDITGMPRWGPPLVDRVAVPSGYTRAIVLQNQVCLLCITVSHTVTTITCPSLVSSLSSQYLRWYSQYFAARLACAHKGGLRVRTTCAFTFHAHRRNAVSLFTLQCAVNAH
jgi:hypothetical protein